MPNLAEVSDQDLPPTKSVENTVGGEKLDDILDDLDSIEIDDDLE